MLKRWGWTAGLVSLAALAGWAAPRTEQEPHWLAANGADWDKMSPEVKRAYTTGVLTGGALAQALQSGARDSAGLVRALDSLRKEGFRFPFAPSVYNSRLEDYYWWENHRPLPLWHAFWEVNNDLKRLTRQDSQ